MLTGSEPADDAEPAAETPESRETPEEQEVDSGARFPQDAWMPERTSGRWDELLRGLVGPASALSPLETLRHSTAHVLAKAVQRLFPETKVTVGGATDEGFYYDVERAAVFSVEEIGKIEAEMQHVVRANEPFVRHELARDAARAMFEALGETYKVELLDHLADRLADRLGASVSSGPVTYYTTGDWLDLCAGPHLRTTGEIRAFKLLGVSGARWCGDEQRPLARIAGTAFGSLAELDAYLSRRNPARR
jgi:threonyl-tRNA synthetase